MMNAEAYDSIEVLPSGASLGVTRGYNRALHRWEVEKAVHVSIADAVVRSEPHLLSTIRHPNVVPVFHAEIAAGTDDVVVFTMPAIDGGSLEDLIETGSRLSVGETISVGSGISSALAYTHHDIGFLHRDVKPANVLVSADHTTGYLTDFGSAARIDQAGRTGAYGFDLYNGDGAAVCAGHFTVATDIYGLGTTLFQACSGPLPFDDYDPEDIYRRVFQQGRRALPNRHYEAFEPHIPQALRRVLRKAMKQSPTDRYQNARDFARDLQRLRVVDWRRTACGDGLVGTWEGRWRSERNADRARTLLVRTHTLTAGQSRGRLRAEGYWLLGSSAKRRRVVPDATIDVDDTDALAAFFDTVDAAVAHNRAAS